MAVGAEEIHHRILGNLEFTVYGKTSIQAGQAKPPMISTEGNGHLDRRIPVDPVAPVHQAVVAVGTAHFHREDPLIRRDVHPVQPDPCFMEDLLNPGLSDIGKVVPVHHDDGPQSTGPQAVDGLEGDFPVGSRISGFDGQLFLDFFGDSRAAPNVAGGSGAGDDQVVSRGSG